MSACEQPPGYVANAEDCDDTRADVYPGAPERCDGLDQDCDGLVDEDGPGVYYPDLDGDGFGDMDAPRSACDPPAGYVEDASDCDDGDPGVHPGIEDTCGDGLDADCDGVDPTCTLAGGALDDLPIQVLAQRAEGNVGRVMALRDLDGDGIADLLAGSPGACEGATCPGLAWWVPGPLSGPADIEDVAARLVGQQEGDDAGTAAAILADLDGDGLGEVLVGASGQDAVAEDAGAAYLLSGVDVAALAPGDAWPLGAGRRLLGEAAGGLAGQAVAAANDLDGQGTAGLAVAAPSLAPDSANQGAVYVLWGLPPDGLGLQDAAGRWTGEATGDNVGSSLFVADLDGDGLDDLAIGARNADFHGEPDAGGVYVVLGPLAGSASLADADTAIAGAAAGDAAGIAVAAAGDQDGDGRIDLLVGATGADGVEGGAGVVYVVRGVPLGDFSLRDAANRILGARTGDQAGRAVAGVGDVDGDGSPDVLVGSPGDAETGAAAGSAALVAGPVLGAVALPDGAVARWVGQPADEAGRGLAGGADLDGDGVADLLVGAWKRSTSEPRAGAIFGSPGVP